VKCPQCHAKTHIRDTRDFGAIVRRRHFCPVCGKRFNTKEIINPLNAESVPTNSENVKPAP
jgi:transcriptional regulator NrdR family protein